ncbi:hypothetical protein IF2G_01350 [Cordyceps javanica]|nr:hypothetical protein IF2G_01350 [Cordyceps javanica]
MRRTRLAYSVLTPGSRSRQGRLELPSIHNSESRSSRLGPSNDASISMRIHDAGCGFAQGLARLEHKEKKKTSRATNIVTSAKRLNA